jgi:uncharacterized protein YbbK (DUF523 family)/uncharacterized protein YbgA (DUF1722 family)
MAEIRLGVSACLLGEQVRHDGGHKRNAFLLEELSRFVRFVPVCPEVGIGLGVPREAIRLVRRGGEIRLIASSGADHTEDMRRWAAATIDGLRRHDLSGFILKKGSPSCGLERVKVWDEARERPVPDGRGLFARALVESSPGLAVEEEGRLSDAGLREHFVDRVFGHARVRDFFGGHWTAEGLVRFHSAEKVAVLAHDPEAARRLGRLVARQRDLEPGEVARRYAEAHAEGFARRATPGRQANALLHLAGHLKESLGSRDRQELREAIEDYRDRLVPVAVPLALLSRHLREAGDDWARSQAYLRPYPKRLGLRGQIAPALGRRASRSGSGHADRGDPARPAGGRSPQRAYIE